MVSSIIVLLNGGTGLLFPTYFIPDLTNFEDWCGQASDGFMHLCMWSKHKRSPLQ